MNQAYHIAKILTLLTALLLLAGLRYGHAQNTSYLPYINSTQKYRVPMGDAGHSVQWHLYEDSYAAPSTTYDLTTLENGGASWITTGTEVIGTDTYAYIEIKYVNTQFTAGESWYVGYSEWDAGVGTGNCVARRTTPLINLTANLFSVTARADDEDCNNFSGDVWPNNINIGDPQDGVVYFTVDMSKAGNHAVKRWSFTGTIVSAGTGYVAPASLFTTTIGSTDGSRGSYSITNVVDNSFTLTVTIDAEDISDPAFTSDAVTIAANITGPAISEVDVTLQITGATAVSGGSYDVETDDNGVGDKDQVLTLLPIPATSIVSIYQ
jgi:hypothetical protein